MITLDRKWVNPLYFILNDLIKDKTIRTILIYGGKSSAKTVSICQILAKEAVVKQSSSIAFRKESTIIKTTLKKSFNLAIDTLYLSPAFDNLEFSYRTSSSEIVLKGLDDPEKAKGIESYKYVYLDELNHFTQQEFEQFNLSLRGIEGQKIFAAWNPVDENSWVKTNLVDSYEWLETDYKLPCPESFVKRSACGKVVLIKTTYEDNYWIVGSPDGSYGYRDENLISEYNELQKRNYNSYRVNVLGEWGKVVFGGEILKCWDGAKHRGSFPYNSECAIYLYFDENVNPYFPCGIFQVGKDEKSLRLIHEVAAKNPNNKVSWMCREINRKLKEWGHEGRIYIGGDATSQKEDVKLEKGHDVFRLIINEMRTMGWTVIRRTASSNPSVILSTDFFNSILEDAVPGISFGADRSCRIAINDYENTKEDKNGKVDKSLITDPLTKVSYQPYGHFFDLTRYAIVSIFASQYAQYQAGGRSFQNMTIGKKKDSNGY